MSASRSIVAESFRIFLPIAVGLSALVAVNYVNEQQLLRLGANEPQTYLADDAAQKVTDGALPQAVAASGTPVAIESSSAPYIVFYDSNGSPIAGTGLLNGALPSLPLGVFDVARQSGEDRLTWQPQSGVREAIVVRPVNDPDATGAAFVMSGRSLAYVEKEETLLGERSALGWLGIMAATFLAASFANWLARRRA